MNLSHEAAISNAWQIHAQLADWTGKVDLKARFGLSFISAVLAGMLAVYGDGTTLHDQDVTLADFARIELFMFISGTVFLVVSLIVSIISVSPQLRAGANKHEYETNIIYFGHLRYWKADDLTCKLREADILPMLASQLVNMSNILWRKHRWIQWSFALALLGVIQVIFSEFSANLF